MRAGAGGGPAGLRILASLAGRVADLIVARDLGARRRHHRELAKRVGRGNAPDGGADRGVGAALLEARSWRGCCIGLFEADLAIKANVMEEEPALVAWLGEHLLARAELGGWGLARRGRLEDPVGLDRERAARSVEAEDADQLLVDVELAARARRARREWRRRGAHRRR